MAPARKISQIKPDVARSQLQMKDLDGETDSKTHDLKEKIQLSCNIYLKRAHNQTSNADSRNDFKRNAEEAAIKCVNSSSVSMKKNKNLNLIPFTHIDEQKRQRKVCKQIEYDRTNEWRFV